MQPRLTLLAASLAAAFGPACAQYSEAERTATAGASAVVGTDDRGLGVHLRYRKIGDYRLTVDAASAERDDRRSLEGGPDLTVRRTGAGLSFAKVIGPRLQFDARLRSEKKEGARLFGVGFNCPSVVAPDCGPTTGTQVGWAVLPLAERLDATHTQFEARLSYGGRRLRLSGGYYGSFYNNSYGSLLPGVPGTLNNALGEPRPPAPGLAEILSLPVALPPDNQAHQVDVAGNYTLTPTTHANFKLAYALATQDQDFAGAGLVDAPAGVNGLDGKVVTTRAQLGLSARPWPKLALHGKLRWQDRDDRTPIRPYNVEGDAVYTNRRHDLTRTRADANARYRFTNDWSAAFGVHYEEIDRGEFTPTSAVAGLSALRQETRERGVRAELRRRMGEDVNGAVILARSWRDGSNWLRDNSGLGVTEVEDPDDPAAGFATAIFMPTLADRRRDSVKLLADWQPSEELQFQLSAQAGADHFDAPSDYGLRRTRMSHVALDGYYTLSYEWKLRGYVSYGREHLRQARPAGYILSFDNESLGAGVGVVGTPRERLEVGASVDLLDDTNKYRQGLDATADAASAALLQATGGLPDIDFRQALFRLYARYAVDDRSTVRVDLLHERSLWTDWAWSYRGVPFTYSDGRVVHQERQRNATFIGVSYVFRWQRPAP